MPLLFAITMFLSATLLFLVQPMVGKMTLPLLGGTPAVWNTCMVFFQALLLLGYLYAHQLTKDRAFGGQTRFHYAVLTLALGCMVAGAILSERNTPIPIVKSLAPNGDEIPFFNVILVLGLAVALPFLVLSTSAPLLQKWFTETGHPSAKDPYFLYGASNFGSLLSLLGYPFAIEPYFTVVQQSYIWAIGYLLLAGLIVACGNAVKRSQAMQEEQSRYASKAKSHVVSNADPDELAPSVLTRLRWLGLAFVPSSLMCGVTTYISTDIASLPLLWVIPLALYLITFIIAFSRMPRWFNLIVTLFAPVLVLLLFFVHSSGTNLNGFLAKIGLHLAVYFVVSLCCHGELARMRPHNTRYLTNFYLTMSVGGMIGGLFNALFAPLVFTYISEYLLTMAIGCMLLPKLDPKADDEGFSLYDFLVPVILFGSSALILSFFRAETTYADGRFIHFFTFGSRDYSDMARSIIFYGLPIMLCYLFVERPLRFGLSVLGIWLAFSQYDIHSARKSLQKRGFPDSVMTRSFFGTLKIEVDWRDEPEFLRLVHGTTLHGMQFRSLHSTPADLEQSSPDDIRVFLLNSVCPSLTGFGFGGMPLETAAALALSYSEMRPAELKPLTYYHPTGPVGYIMKALRDRQAADPATNTDTACIGLGTGSLSAYGQPGQNITFFEIDTVVRRLVEPGQYFTFVKKAKERGVNLDFQMGDARLTLERMNDRKFALMFVDAFSSDAIPVHLLTKEAMELYFSRLHENGLLAVHISNRYLELEPVVKVLAETLGVEARVMHDDTSAPGKTASTWILLTRKLEYMGDAILEPRKRQYYRDGSVTAESVEVWGPLKEKGKKVALWTDDYSPVIPILNENLKFWKFWSKRDE